MPITPQDAISFLVAAGGNARLAAARAARVHNDDTITEPRLLSLIASDPNSQTALAAQARVLLLLSALDAFRVAQQTFIQKLPDLPPAQIALAYPKLLTAISLLLAAPTTSPTPTTTPAQQLLASLPPEVADAVEFLLRNPQTPDTNSSDDPHDPLNPMPILPRDPQLTPSYSPTSDDRTPLSSRALP